MLGREVLIEALLRGKAVAAPRALGSVHLWFRLDVRVTDYATRHDSRFQRLVSLGRFLVHVCGS